MIVYNVGIRGGLKKIRKADFKEDDVYLIDDTKSLYVWFGSSISKKRKDLTINKANILSQKKKIPVNIQIVSQNKEYGSFLAIKDLLKKGIKPRQDLDRRPELEIQYKETVELIDAGIDLSLIHI